MNRFSLARIAIVSVAGLLLTGCVTGSSEPAATVTKTVQERITITATPAPQYGLMNPDLQSILVEVCSYVEENEPRWSALQEAGPYDGFPADVFRIRSLARQANETYQWVFERLNYGAQASDGNTIYGQIFTDIANRANFAITLEPAADSYLRTGDDYDRLYFMWAAYTGSIESRVSGCSFFD